MEAYANPTTLNGTAGNSAPVGGKRRSRKVRKVAASTIKKTLRHLGLKPKGRVVLKGGDVPAVPAAAAPAAEAPKGGRRHRKSHRKSGLRKLFNL
uniref:Uncharacterized protein n=1 Tax=viral metagenome TaxID=1070528 RepID=A0A6C0KEJ5_9ZZZZ